MRNILVARKLELIASDVADIRCRLPDPRRYPHAIALLQTEAEKLRHVNAGGAQQWATDKAREMDAALRVLGGEPAS